MTAEGGRRPCGHTSVEHVHMMTGRMAGACDYYPSPAAQPSESEREGAEPHRYRGGVNGCAVCGGGLGEPEHWLGEPGRSPQSSVEAPPSPPSTGQSREPFTAEAFAADFMHWYFGESNGPGQAVTTYRETLRSQLAAKAAEWLRALESKP
jgi:hypothetical protein